MHAPSSSDVLLWILCFVIVVAAGRKIWPFLRQFVHVVDLLSELPTKLTAITNRLDGQDEKLDGQDEKLDQIGERFNTQDETLAKIQHEVENNDGSSLKDSTNRTEQLARQTSKDLADHLEWSKKDTQEVRGRFDRIEAQIAGEVDQN